MCVGPYMYIITFQSVNCPLAHLWPAEVRRRPPALRSIQPCSENRPLLPPKGRAGTHYGAALPSVFLKTDQPHRLQIQAKGSFLAFFLWFL